MDLVFEVANTYRHTAGNPPAISANQDVDNGQFYHSYFEDENQDQWVFVRDRRTGRALLFGGAIGWEAPYLVTVSADGAVLPGPLGDQSSHAWLLVCVLASGVYPEQELLRPLPEYTG